MFKAHRRLYHSTLGPRVIMKIKRTAIQVMVLLPSASTSLVQLVEGQVLRAEHITQAQELPSTCNESKEEEEGLSISRFALKCRVWGRAYMVEGSGLRVQSSGFRVRGSRFRDPVSGVGFSKGGLPLATQAKAASAVEPIRHI